MWKQYKALEMSPDDRSFRWPRPTTVTTPALLLTQNVTHNVTHSRVHNVTQHDDSAYSCSSKFHRMTTPKWQHTCFTLPWLTMTSLRQASDKFHHLLKFWGQFTPSDCPVLVIISSSSVCTFTWANYFASWYIPPGAWWLHLPWTAGATAVSISGFQGGGLKTVSHRLTTFTEKRNHRATSAQSKCKHTCSGSTDCTYSLTTENWAALFKLPSNIIYMAWYSEWGACYVFFARQGLLLALLMLSSMNSASSAFNLSAQNSGTLNLNYCAALLSWALSRKSGWPCR